MHEAEDPRIARVRDVFESWAREGRAEGMERGHGRAARRGFELLELPREGWYLDVGCGNGYTVRWAAEAAPDGWAVGIDLAPAMVERARAASAAIPNVEFQVARFPDTALPHGCFDAVLSMEVLYYLPDMDDALREIARLLVPGGRFVCVVDYYEENPASHGWPEEMGVQMTRLDAAGWRQAVERAGLVVSGQERVTEPEGADPTHWKVTAGSLLTLARRGDS
jgi:SAM-dependent methyltransferase